MANSESERVLSYTRLYPDESPMIMNRHMPTSQGSSSHIAAPIAAPSEHYVRRRNVSKYTSALRSLIPFRRKTCERTELPLDDIGFFALVTFSWMAVFIKKSLPSESLTTAKLDSSNLNGQRLKDFLRDENVRRGQTNARMMRTAWRFVQTRIIVSSIIYILGSAMYIIGLVFFLSWFRQTHEIHFLLVLVFMCSSALLLQFWSESMTFRTANRLQSAFMSVMYKHLLRISILHPVSAHRIVTAMAADSQRVHDAVMCLPVLLSTPVILMLPIPMLLLKIDCDVRREDFVFAGLICLLITPILYLLARLSNVWKSHMSIYTSKRLISLQELLLHIPLVKMTLREKLFHRNAEDLREKECQYMKKVNLCDGFTVSFLHIVPLVVVILLWYQREDITLKEDVTVRRNCNADLTSLIILVLIPFKELLFSFWLGMINLFDGLMAFRRLKRVLVLECVMKRTSRKPINHLIALSAIEATYVIRKPSTRGVKRQSRRCDCCRCTCVCGHREIDDVEMQAKTVLKEINFEAPKERLIGICGDTSSGKTALIWALLGQINPVYGSDKLLRDGTYAYVGQNPWIMEATLRENVLFNEPFIHKRYYHVIHCCSLNDDIGQLSGGDQTLISESTLTLGQKQRIALARALYANRDIYLLDDLLSAVSSDVSSIIFERSIQKHLKGKTVIITSRQVKFLKLCDEIFVLKDAAIIEHGTHDCLMEMDLYPLLIKSYLQEESNKNIEDEKSYNASFGTIKSQNGRETPNLAESVVRIPDSMEDEIEQESVAMVAKYNNSMGFYKTLALETKSSVPLLTSLIFTLICILCALTVIISPVIILECLTENSTRYVIALAFFFIILVSRTVGTVLFDQVTYKISLQVHQSWIESICKGCLNIFQNASHSEILRWFSLHLSEIDTSLPSNSILLVENLFLVLLLICVLSICSLWFLIPIIAICVFSHFLLRFTNSALLKFYHRAEEACLRLNGFVASTVMGRVTIQAFGKEQDYWTVFHNQCDTFLAYSQLNQAACLWLRFWIQFASLCFIMIILGIMCIKDDAKEWVFFFGGSNLYLIPTTISIFCAFLLGYILNNVTQTSTSMSSKFIVLGNHDATVRSIKPEDDSNLPYVMPNPFANGSIVFRDVKLEFWPDSQPSWRGLSFHVQSGEKIGILGLPGSGKTAIIGALYKLANLSQGSVYIGDVDIKTAPVDYVRSSIALVPKNPLMFSGTLRINIDPMHRYSLRELCESLEKVGIYQKIEDLPNLLETQTYYIEERLSVQERQLLYVAQAVLRDPKILILEEPIEPVGTKDMFKVLDVVEQLFHCTILVVAHNMKYAAKCDRIIIVKDGQVAEFDTPENLFRNPNSCFSQMLSTSAENLLETEV